MKQVSSRAQLAKALIQPDNLIYKNISQYAIAISNYTFQLGQGLLTPLMAKVIPGGYVEVPEDHADAILTLEESEYFERVK